MAAIKKNLPISLLEENEGQLSKIDPETNQQIGLPRNPRWIRDARFEALKKSIEDAPEMLDLRELMVYSLSEIKGKDGKYIVIGGNQRLKALRELGYKEVPCKVLDPETPMEKLREYTIKDNEAFGQNDWDVLADEWPQEELEVWGMEIDSFSSTVDFDRVDNISDENYETPKTKMLECPKCHHKDFAIHFKSFEADANAEITEEEIEIIGESKDDLPKE